MRWNIRTVAVESPVTTAAWGTDDRLYTSHRDGSLWRQDSDGMTARVEGHAGGVSAIAADANGVVSAGMDRKLTCWNAELEAVCSLHIPSGDDVIVTHVAVSQTRVAALLRKNIAPVVLATWSRTSGKGQFARRVADGCFATGLAFAPDDSFVASVSSNDQIVVLRDGVATTIAGRSEGQENFLQAVAVPDPTAILCASRYFWIRRIDVASGRTTHKLQHRAGGTMLLLAPCGEDVLVGAADGGFALWSLESRAIVSEFALPRGNWTIQAANRAGTRVLAASESAAVIIELEP